MRSRKNYTITSRQVQVWAQQWLSTSLHFHDHGPLCTAAVLFGVLLFAAASAISVAAACKRLVSGPSDQAVRNAVRANLPKRIGDLEKRLNASLVTNLPKRLLRRARELAIDYHLVPYHGEPARSKKELYRSQPKSGTTKFHAYATVCVVEKGFRYTLAFTWVKAGETPEAVIARLLQIVWARGVKIRRLLLDRGFFSVAVMRYLQGAGVPFVMPVVMRGRKPKDPRRPVSGLRAFLKKRNGWYTHTMKSKGQQVTFAICVSSKRYRHHRTRKQYRKKLVYAAWKVREVPRELRELYRRRFGIESSYRQLGEARIRTSTRDPALRLLFVGIALVLRNVWVWLHLMVFAEPRGRQLRLHLEKLRLGLMLHWIASVVLSCFQHDDLYSTQAAKRPRVPPGAKL
jgi:hypothetical protein